MGEVLKQINEYTRFVSMYDDYNDSGMLWNLARPDGDCYPPTMIFGRNYDPNVFGEFPLEESWLNNVDQDDNELLARHIRIVLGLGTGDVVVETLRDNSRNDATMVVVATPEWREMVGYSEDLKPSDYNEIKHWWEEDYDVAIVERLETTVIVGLDGSTRESTEWVEDEDNVVYPTYGWGAKRDAYLEDADVDTKRLPTSYVASYNAREVGESVESVLEKLRARVKSDLVIR